MAKITFVTGGARSGKSTFAENLVREKGERILYTATAKAIDEEMVERIRRHQNNRPAEWDTLESYRGLGEVLPERSGQYQGMLLDCVTIMSTNLLFDHPAMAKEEVSLEEMNAAEAEVMAEIDHFIASFSRLQADLIMVSNEVGFGLVPEYPLARFFRDVLGRVNQRLAAAADEAYLVVSGLTVKLKG